MHRYLETITYHCSTVKPRVRLVVKRVMAEEQQNVSMTCTAIGKPRTKITWSKAVDRFPDGKAVVRNGQVTLYNVTRKEGGVYICKAENILGTSADTVLLMIFSRLQFKFLPPKILTPILGSTVRLPCLEESDLRPTVTWTKNDQTTLPADSNVLINGTLLIPKMKKSHEGIYSCRATNALTTIEATVRVNSKVVSPSCSVIKKHAGGANGNYVIYPDGEGGLAPFTVYCDMSDKNGVGVTVISHDSESRTLVKGCETHGCYSRDVHYTGASLSQLASLTRVSSHCEQFIKYECDNSMLLRGGNAWWVARHSTKMTYWGGASPGSGKCACGMTNSCANTTYSCNCDKNDDVWREDSGLLTDKSNLPVRQLRFGDTGHFFEKGYHTLGKLKCYGTADK